MAVQPVFESVETLQTRSIPDMDLGSSTIDDMMLRLQGAKARPWRAASVREAMGTPAIFRAISLIANTTGSLAVETFRNGEKLSDADAPALVKRPDPFRTPRAFYRDSAYHLASRGESWWWVARRDGDGNALSLIVVPPWEVTVDTSKDRLRPTIKWLEQEIPRDDMRLITFMPDERSPTGPFQRGVGPLQLCGAAISVAVEAQEWAANFYHGGGRPPLIIQAAGELGQNDEFANAKSEAQALREQWMDGEPNTPRVIDEGIKDITYPPESSQGGQMLEARNNENGNAARMFGIPGSLLEYQQAGSSLTYQNLEGEFTKFVKGGLAPGYLEPIEQEMSDLLTRSTVARFAVKGFTRADQKTRWEIYQIMVAVLGPEEAAVVAREQEGLSPGDVEFAPIPFSPPSARPTLLPIQTRSEPIEVRCDGKRMLRGLLKPCNRLLSTTGSFSGMCPRCKKQHHIAAPVAPTVVQRPVPMAVRSAPTLRVVEPEPATMAEPESPREQPIYVQPTINIPSQPINVTVDLPKAEAHMIEVHEEVAKLGGYMVDLAGHVERMSTDQGLLESRISGLAETQDGLIARLNQPPKARTFVPKRDKNGVIVSVTEAS
jgi:HK97 family phage portal protein